MSFVQRGHEVLQKAEMELRGLIEEASNAADYDSVLALGQLAKALSLSVTLPPPLQLQAETAIQPAFETAPSKPRRGSNKVRRTKRNGALKSKAYPRFERDAEFLVKVGWSKSAKDEYEHRAHHDVLRVVISTLVATGKLGSRFQMENVLPILNGKHGEIPSYQVYLCVAWLRGIGLIEQHGRQGYSIPRGTDLLRSAEAALAGVAVR